MKNFDWTSFTKKIAVKADLPTLYDAWTKAAEIEKWFLSHAAYRDENGQNIDPTTYVAQGHTYEWNWYLYDVTENGRITEANGKDSIQFTFAGECLVDIRLTSFNDHIIVELTQKNIPTDDASKQGIRLGCESGWSFFLVNLKSVYEGGIDLRNKKTELKGMVNS
ncbi:MAG: SRPBCC domain-containing protein [Bacteroidota bacterium]